MVFVDVKNYLTQSMERPMTTAQGSESQFLVTLADFEKCLGTPVIPGEMSAWLQTVRKAFEGVRSQFCREVQKPHDQLLNDMVEQDFEMAQRAEQMKAEDRQLLSQIDDLHAKFERLCEMSKRGGTQEAKLDKDVEKFADEALRFVVACRKHETALTTWYMEAFNRDRGIAD